MSFLKRASAILLVLVFVCSALVGCGDKIDGKKTALTVNGEEVSLGTVSFLAKYDASIIYSYYGSYMGEDYFEEPYEDYEDTPEATGNADAAEAAEAENAEAEEPDENVKTIGDQMVLDAADEAAEMVILSQHAEEYGVSVTDEEKTAIDAAAQDYIDNNTKEVKNSVGASKEDIVRLLELNTIKSKMLDALAAEVDGDISDEEAQQTTATVLTIRVADLTEPAEDTADTAEGEEAEPQEAMTEDEARAKIKEDLGTILEKLKNEADPAAADVDALAKEVSEDYSAYPTSWSTNDEEQDTVSMIIYDTAKTMKDGEVYPEILSNEDESEYYIIRLDAAFDEEATSNQKAYLYYEREQSHYDETVDAWKEESEIVNNEEALSDIKITGNSIFAFKAPETTEGTTEEGTEEGAGESTEAEAPAATEEGAESNG